MLAMKGILPLLLSVMFCSESQAIDACEVLLRGELYGARVGRVFSGVSYRGMRRSVKSDRIGLEQLVFRSTSGDLNVYLNSAKEVRALSLIAKPKHSIAVCPGLTVGTSTFENISKTLGLDAEIKEPIWSESEMVYYGESYRIGFVRLTFVAWTNCANQGLSCEDQAGSRRMVATSLYVE